ncbi:MAG TPA: hypothetical protein VNM72_09975 [Blastocatellia bacterium]|nr:hypothetical protein [Blastocatellia bacterium]
MRSQYFSRQEAEAKIGKRIRNLVPLPGIERGTDGVVIGADFSGKGYRVAVQWCTPRGSRPAVELFYRDEYYAFFEEN